MTENSLRYIISSIRAQIKALDILLEIFEQQVTKCEPDDKIYCPACGTELTTDHQYAAMGIGTNYACPNCDFRGKV